MTNTIKRSSKPSISLGSDEALIEFAYRQADLYHGGNLSGYLQRLIAQDKRAIPASSDNLMHMFGIAQQLANRHGIEVELRKNATDFILPRHKIGIECKTRFNMETGEAGMLSAMSFTAGNAGCNTFWIVTASDIAESDAARFRQIAMTFPYGRIEVIPFSDLEGRFRQLGSMEAS